MAVIDEIENYPGVPETTGAELSERMLRQARGFGAQLVMDEVKGADLQPEVKTVRGARESYRGHTVIIATGASPRRLNVPGEEELRGRGVSYCATCDGAFFRDQKVAVVGGGNAAVQEAIYLSRLAERVLVVHRRGQLRADDVLQARAFNVDRIHFAWNSVVEELKGDDVVEQIVLRNVEDDEISREEIDGVFVYIGTVPNTDFLPSSLRKDGKGYVVTDEDMSTNIEGVFAAGDVRPKLTYQITTAVGDGTTASVAAEHYLTKKGVLEGYV